jgi:hypothetical protein
MQKNENADQKTAREMPGADQEHHQGMGRQQDAPQIDLKRRDFLKQIGRVSYMAPATLAVLSMKANATSGTC